jgi:CTP synthase (UTP-ammonia lyase)
MIRLALVGDRSPQVRAHVRIPARLEAVARQGGPTVDALWVGTDTVDERFDARAFDGVWLTPGSPYRSREGALLAVRSAREGGVPFLGTCGGFQHALLEFARSAAGLAGAAHAEYGEAGGPVLIAPLACSLVGEEGTIHVTPGTLAERTLGALTSVERYHCAYGPVADRLPDLEAAGMRFTAFDDDGHARVLELPGHPFFLGTLFQPELAAPVHPAIRAFVAAMAREGAAAVSA